MRFALKALSALLTYPSAELAAAIPEIEAGLSGEGALDTRALASLSPLLARLGNAETMPAEEIYVGLFDRTRGAQREQVGCTGTGTDQIDLSHGQPRSRSCRRPRSGW